MGSGDEMVSWPERERLMPMGWRPPPRTLALWERVSPGCVGRMMNVKRCSVAFTRSFSSGPPCPQLLPPSPVTPRSRWSVVDFFEGSL